MTTNTGYVPPDLSFLHLKDDKLEKVNEILNAAIQAHMALNNFNWYKKSAGKVTEQIGSLKKELTDATSKQLENLASKLKEKTGLDVSGLAGGEGDSGLMDIAGKALKGDIKGLGNLAKEQALKRITDVDPSLGETASKALSGNLKGALQSAGDVAKEAGLAKLRQVNPEASQYIEQALNGNLEQAARDAALNKLKEMNPEASKYVEQAMSGDIKGAAKSMAMNELQKVNPEAAGLAQQAMSGDIKSVAKSMAMDQLKQLNPEAAGLAQQALSGDIKSTLKSAALSKLQEVNPDAAALAQQVLSGGDIVGTAKSMALEQAQNLAPDVNIKAMANLVKDPASIKQAVVDAAKSKLSEEVNPLMDQVGDIKSALGKEGVQMFQGGDLVLNNLGSMTNQSFRDFLQSSDVASTPIVQTVLEGNTKGFFRKAKLPELGDEDFETAGRMFADTAGAIDRGESFLAKTGSALSDTIAKLKTPFSTGSDSTIARAIGQAPNLMQTEIQDLTMRRAAQVAQNQMALSKPAAQATNVVTPAETANVMEDVTKPVVSEATKTGESVGKSLGEDIAKDTAETAALDETGIGEIVDAGLVVGQLFTSFADLFKHSPKPLAVEEGEQVGL